MKDQEHKLTAAVIKLHLQKFDHSAILEKLKPEFPYLVLSMIERRVVKYYQDVLFGRVKPKPRRGPIEYDEAPPHSVLLMYRRGCAFPYEVGPKQFRFCNRPKKPHSSYCEAHHSIVYVTPKPKQKL